MRHLKKIEKKSPEWPRENVSPGPAVALDGPAHYYHQRLLVRISTAV